MIQVSEQVISILKKAGQIQSFPKSSLIYLQGDSSAKLHLVTRGRVRMFFFGEDGKEVTFQIIGEGQFFGESAFLSHASGQTSISAVTDVSLISISAKNLLPYLSQSEELSITVLHLLSDNYQFLCNQVKRLSVYDSHQKVASYLVEQTMNNPSGVGIHNDILPYTHEELGVCLGLNRVTVTKILNQFRAQGYVELGRKKIKVLDMEGLTRIYAPDGDS